MSKFVMKLALMVLGLACAASLQAQTVKGVVKDGNGEPVMGAFVLVEGTSNGTSTGLDGDYTINVPDISKAVLQFSMIGMKTVSIPVNGNTVVDAVLTDDSTFLDEVVVVGYATVKRRDLLGSVSSINSDKLVEQPVNTVGQALSGKMAGVSVTTTEGDPDADIKIRVRGGGSITQDNSPLYIVDGFPVESINDISSSEIASIDVLKDAFSTAIYGSRGANGVVIVTTKSGEKGRKSSVTFNTYYGFKTMANKNAIQTMDSENFVKFRYELGLLRDNLSSAYEPYFGSFADIDQYYGLQTNDWIDIVFGNTGSTFNTDFSVSGSGEDYQWTLGYAHLDDQAIMTGSNYSRDNLNFKSQFKPSKKTTIDLNVRYSNTNVRGAGANSISDNSGSTSSLGRLKHSVLYTPIPVTSSEEDEDSYGDAAPPVQSVNDNDSKKVRTTWNANAAFTWKIIDNLNLKIEGGLEEYRQTSNRFYGMSTYTVYNAGAAGPAATYTDVSRKRYRNTNTVSYNFEELIKNDDHHLDAMFGEEMTLTKSNTHTASVTDLPSFYGAELAWNFLSNGTPSSVSTYYDADDNLVSFFGRINYDYKHKYSLGATLRTDGSSKFSKANRWGFFPSLAASWTMSNEPWMQNASWIDQLKLRYSFGTAGNNNIPTGQVYKAYSAYTTTDPTSLAIISTSSNYMSAGKVLNNENLKWETTYTNNVGVDFSFLQGKVSGSFEVYQNDTKDLLINYTINGVGYDSQYQNIGSTRNRGVELSLNMPLIQKKDFSLNLSGNISYNRNTVVSLGGASSITAETGWASSEIGTDYLIEEGKPLGNMYGYICEGMFTVDDFNYMGDGKWELKKEYDANGKVISAADNSSVIGKAFMRPGGMKIKDLDGDGIITASDKTVIGNAIPDLQGGFALSAYFKGFDFSANFSYMIGNDVYNANKIEFNSSRKYDTLRNLTTLMNVANRWSNVNWETGELIDDPDELAAANEGKTQWAPFTQNAVFSDWAVEDGSFLRLQSVTLGYTLPEKLTEKVHIRKLRVYATGTNLFCLTKYSGYDPEVDCIRRTSLTPGVDCSAYPKSIGCVFGLNLTF